MCKQMQQPLMAQQTPEALTLRFTITSRQLLDFENSKIKFRFRISRVCISKLT